MSRRVLDALQRVAAEEERVIVIVIVVIVVGVSKQIKLTAGMVVDSVSLGIVIVVIIDRSTIYAVIVAAVVWFGVVTMQLTRFVVIVAASSQRPRLRAPTVSRWRRRRRSVVLVVRVVRVVAAAADKVARWRGGDGRGHGGGRCASLRRHEDHDLGSLGGGSRGWSR